MKKYRNKPVIKEAIQLTRMFSDIAFNWIGEDNIDDFNLGGFSEDACFIEIKTLEGTMTANEGDYIIKGIKGEFYPCKEDIFNNSYEEVTE